MLAPLFSRSRAFRLRTLLLAVAMLAAGSAATAQGGHGGGPPGGGGMGGGGRGQFGGVMSQNLRTTPPPPPANGEATSSMRGGLQLGPPGRWWDDKGFARTLGIDSSQQHRMDDIFNTNKPALVKLFKSVQHEESQLEKLTRNRHPDESQIFSQIDRVTQARGELEKASAHYMLTIRKEMTDEQTARLDDHRPNTD
jgi:Spy/CpxP family protein refolding chaperone